MRKALVLIVTFMWILHFPAFSDEGFRIKVHNSHLGTINYNIFQIDHGFPDWPGPFVIMGGELESGQEYISPNFRNFGKYFVQWFTKDEKFKKTIPFTVQAPTKRIIIFCDKIIFQ